MDGFNQPRPMDRLTPQDVQAIVGLWPRPAAYLAQTMLARYGMPNEAMPSCLLWYFTEPWLRTLVHRDGVYHNFPRTHLDLLEQVVPYRVPNGRVAEIARYDGSITVNRTAGEMTAHCESEEMNFVSVNLAHLIAIGAIDAQEARRRHLHISMALRLGWGDALAEGITFTLAGLDTARMDPDRATVAPARAVQS